MNEPERIDHAAARALLNERNVFSAIEWWPRQASSGVLLYRGDVSLPSLRLDFGELGADGVIIDGHAVVEGAIQNGEMDFGPFLVVLGNLTVDNVAIAGAPLYVRGNLRMSGAFHGYYNHGTATIAGDIDAQAVVADDYFLHVGGNVRAPLVAARGHLQLAHPVELSSAESVLDPAFLIVEWVDDERAVRCASDAIYEQLVAGGSILRGAEIFSKKAMEIVTHGAPLPGIPFPKVRKAKPKRKAKAKPKAKVRKAKPKPKAQVRTATPKAKAKVRKAPPKPKPKAPARKVKPKAKAAVRKAKPKARKARR